MDSCENLFPTFSHEHPVKEGEFTQLHFDVMPLLLDMFTRAGRA